MGRQPWIVYGLMKTANAVSPIALSQVIFSIIGLTLFYGILIVADIYLLQKYAKAGPGQSSPTTEGHTAEQPDLVINPKNATV
jgi:cytochrome d ubiquinol oxidase subunit I